MTLDKYAIYLRCGAHSCARACGALCLSVLALFPNLGSAQTKIADVSIGSVYAFPSTFLKGDVPVSIHLPPDYDKGDGRYPVFYLLDFGNDFKFAAAVADFLYASDRTPGLIVAAVAVDNLSGPPQAALDFLEKELFPYVEKTYRTHPCRLLYGHSGRSFATLFILLNRPDLFYAYICPGLGLAYPPFPGAADFIALATARLSELTSLPKCFYFSVGDEQPFLQGITRFMEVLKANAPKDFEWRFAHMETDDHFSTKLKTLYEGLEFAFRGLNLPLDVAAKGADAVKDHYARLSQRLGFPINLSQPQTAKIVDDAIVRMAGYQNRLRLGLALNRELREKLGFPGITEGSFGLIGYFAMNEKRYEEAVELFTAMSDAYPQSGTARNGLGEAHEKLGRLDQALADFEEACELAKASNNPRLAAFQTNLERVRRTLKKSR
jgi:tetratricopeptide (TPR) repeat protein